MKTWGTSGYVIELANKIRGGRSVGNVYVVTRRGVGMSGILSRHDSKGAALKWIRSKLRDERKARRK